MQWNGPYFLVICGIDGSGKTTLIDRICHDFPQCEVSHWQRLLTLGDQCPLNGFPLNTTAPADYIHTLSPMQRALYVSTLLWVEYETFIKPALDQGKMVIADSYYYKFFAKEQVFRQSHPLLFDLLTALPQPDQVIVLDLEPEHCYTRKRHTTAYETNGTTQEEYLQFQRQVRLHLLEVVRTHQDNFVIFDASYPDDSVYNSIKDFLRKHQREEVQ
jgi:thymidylate kinase